MMWHKSVLVSLFCAGSLTSSQQPYRSFSVSPSVADQSKELTSVAMEETKLWYATQGGEVYVQEPDRVPTRVINDQQSGRRLPAFVAAHCTERSSRVCFGTDTLHLHTSRQTEWRSDLERITTIAFSPTGNHLFATLFSNQSVPGQTARLVGFDVSNGSLPDAPTCSIDLSDQAVRLCKVNQKGSGTSVRIVSVEGGSTIRVLHGDMNEHSSVISIVSTHAPLNAPIYDMAWYGERELCFTCGKKLCIKSYTGGNPTFSLTSSVPLGPVEVVDDALVVGTSDGRVMLVDMDMRRLRTLATFALSRASRPVCHIASDSSCEPPQLTLLVEDERSRDQEGDYLNWPPATPADSEVVRPTELKRIDATLAQLRRFPRVTDPLPNAACKKWSYRIAGGLSTVGASAYFLYWLTYCTHQSEGTWCP